MDAMDLLPVVFKDGPAGGDVHVDSIIGATRSFNPGPRCSACGVKNGGHAVGCEQAVTIEKSDGTEWGGKVRVREMYGVSNSRSALLGKASRAGALGKIGKAFDPSEARDPKGEWTSGASGGGTTGESPPPAPASTPNHQPDATLPLPDHARGVGVSLDPNSQSLLGPHQAQGEPAEHFHQRIFDSQQEHYEPAGFLKDGATGYRDARGLPQPHIQDWTKVEAPYDRLLATGAAFENAPSDPDSPYIKAAYRDLVAQTTDQWHLLTDPVDKGGLGVTVEFPSPAELRTKYGDAEGLNPYKTAKAQRDDIVNNHHLAIASIHDYTVEGGADPKEAISHPLLATDRGGEYDKFRAVHDAFGHAGIGADFTRHGEYQAWLHHSSMFSELGRLAASTELTGENSFLARSGILGHPSPAPHKAAVLPQNLISMPWDAKGDYDPTYWEAKPNPHLIGAVRRWVADEVGAQHPDATDTEALQLGVADSRPVAHTLLRGMRGHDIQDRVVAEFKPGHNVVLPLASYTESDVVAEDVERGRLPLHPPLKMKPGDDGQGMKATIMGPEEIRQWRNDFLANRPYGAQLRIKPGAQAIDVNSLKEPTEFSYEKEYISAGTYHVDQVTRDPMTGRVVVDLTMVASVDPDAKGDGAVNTDGTLVTPEDSPSGLVAKDLGLIPLAKVYDDTETRDDHGRWSGTPGTKALKPNHVRLFHRTDPANLADIKANGLHPEAGNGPSRQVPRVWGSVRQQDYDFGKEAVVEYQADADAMRSPASLYGPPVGQSPEDYTAAGGNEFGGDFAIPPEDILAIHEPKTSSATGSATGALNISHSARDIVSAGIANGGFTWNVADGTQPTTGYIVAVQGHSSITPLADPDDPAQRKLLAQNLVKFVRDNADLFRANPNLHLGGWHDVAHGEFTLDPVERVEDKESAVSLGRDRNQQAIWDIAGKTAIQTGGTGDRDLAKASGRHASPGGWDGRGVGDLGLGSRELRTGSGERAPLLPLLLKDFDPNEARDPSGRWTAGAGGGKVDGGSGGDWDPLAGKSGATSLVIGDAISDVSDKSRDANQTKSSAADGTQAKTGAEIDASMWEGRLRGLIGAQEDLAKGSDGTAFAAKIASLDKSADEENKNPVKGDASHADRNLAAVAFWRGQADAYRSVVAHMAAGGYTPPVHPEPLSGKPSTVKQADMTDPTPAPPDEDEEGTSTPLSSSNQVLNLMSNEERGATKRNVMTAITDRMVAVYGDKFDEQMAERADMGTNRYAENDPLPWESRKFLAPYMRSENIVYDQGNGSFGINTPSNGNAPDHQPDEVWEGKEYDFYNHAVVPNGIKMVVAFLGDGTAVARHSSGQDTPENAGAMGRLIDHGYSGGYEWKQTGGPTYDPTPIPIPADVPQNALRSARGGTPEAARLMREAAVSGMIHQWAQTSNDTHPESLAIQRAAVAEFDLKGTSKWHDYDAQEDMEGGEADTAFKKNGEMYRAFLRSQYDATQEWFKSQGIKSLTLWRGIKGEPDENDAEVNEDGNVSISLRPLSSWAVEPSTARSFGSATLKAEVPVNHILSTALTGNGALSEHEAVVIGGDVTVGQDSSSEWSPSHGQANVDAVNSWSWTSDTADWGQSMIEDQDDTDFEADSDWLQEMWDEDMGQQYAQASTDWLGSYHPELSEKTKNPNGTTQFGTFNPNDVATEFIEQAYDSDDGEYPPQSEELEEAFKAWVGDRNDDTFADWDTKYPERRAYTQEWLDAKAKAPGGDTTHLVTEDELAHMWDNHEKGYEADNFPIHPGPDQAKLGDKFSPSGANFGGNPFDEGPKLLSSQKSDVDPKAGGVNSLGAKLPAAPPGYHWNADNMMEADK